MRIVIALGGNALLRRGEPLTARNQRENVRIAARALAPLAASNELIISHGNGPQVGLLALQAAAYDAVEPYPLDVLGAQTEGMIGYMIEQELGNLLPFEQPFASILTMVEVDPADPAFANPTKFIGPEYDAAEADELARRHGWTFRPDGDRMRRVVPSPVPRRIFQIRPIRWLLERGVIVICTGGGGIPTVYDADRKLRGAEVVVDKDLASALLAYEVQADLLVMATDVDAVYENWGTPEARPVRSTTWREIQSSEYAAGSMGPKIAAACRFAKRCGKPAVIGALRNLEAIVRGESGTRIEPE